MRVPVRRLGPGRPSADPQGVVQLLHRGRVQAAGGGQPGQVVALRAGQLGGQLGTRHRGKSGCTIAEGPGLLKLDRADRLFCCSPFRTGNPRNGQGKIAFKTLFCTLRHRAGLKRYLAFIAVLALLALYLVASTFAQT